MYIFDQIKSRPTCLIACRAIVHSVIDQIVELYNFDWWYHIAEEDDPSLREALAEDLCVDPDHNVAALPSLLHYFIDNQAYSDAQTIKDCMDYMSHYREIVHLHYCLAFLEQGRPIPASHQPRYERNLQRMHLEEGSPS